MNKTANLGYAVHGVYNMLILSIVKVHYLVVLLYFHIFQCVNKGGV